MKTTVALLFICVGAIFAFAVTTNTSVLNLHTMGFVLIFIGLLGMFLSRGGYGWVRTRMIRRTRRWPGGSGVTETTYPSYVVHDPGARRVTAGLPAAREGSEVVEEDVYEEE
jgi:hypothetical protein